MSRLLLIDDDIRLTDMVGAYLRDNGFEVDTAASLAAGRDRLKKGSYDALVLDLMLPDGDGLEFTRELRSQPRTRRLPLLMLTARGESTDRIVGLEIGADDYLGKPFEARELLARVKALLRRAGPDRVDDDVLVFGRLEVDLGARQARLDGRPCDLTGHQFELLTVLARSPGRVPRRSPMPKFFVRWVVSSAAIAIVAWLLPGIRAGTGTTGAITVVVAAAVLGLLNTFVKPLLKVLSCPLILLTLGLFLFIINAALLMATAAVSRAFGYPLEVDGWGSALLGSILISIVTWMLSLFVPDGDDKE